MIDVGDLYDDYDDIECNDVPVNTIHTSFCEDGVNVQHKTYDLCQICCFDFARWLVNPDTVVRFIQDEETEHEEVDTRLFADGEELLTVKPNGEIEWHNQIQEEPEEPEYLYTITNKITGEKTNVYKEGVDDET